MEFFFSIFAAKQEKLPIYPFISNWGSFISEVPIITCSKNSKNLKAINLIFFKKKQINRKQTKNTQQKTNKFDSFLNCLHWLLGLFPFQFCLQYETQLRLSVEKVPTTQQIVIYYYFCFILAKVFLRRN